MGNDSTNGPGVNGDMNGRAPGPSLDAVPAELRQLPQWVCWKTLVRAGKPTKVPVQSGGWPAKANDPKTWTTFAASARAFRSPNKKFSGLGFFFSESDPYVGVDFDNCLNGGEIAEWASPWLDALAGGYMEVSPSGNGIHVFVRGKLPGSGRGRGLGSHTGIELYDRGRFFCTTGDVYGAAVSEIPDHQDVIDRLYAWAQERPDDAPRVAPSAPPKSGPGEWTPESRAIAYLEKVDPAISGERGHDTTLRAACGIVEFGIVDPEAVFRLLRDHYNPKCQPAWSDKELMHKAKSAVQKAEPGKKLRQDRPKSDVVKARPTQSLDARLAKLMRTDIGNGERLTARYGQMIRYCEPWGKWLVWDGKRYALDRTKATHRLAKKAARQILAEAAAIEDDDERKKHTEHAIVSQGRSRIDSMIAMAASEPTIPILPEDMDRDGWLFNCMNGTVDLRTGELRPHDQADLITQLCPLKFDPHAECPLWDSTLDLFFAGDRAMIAYWQRVCGYALVGIVRDHVMPVAYGDGSNGKSTILGTLLEVMGADYAMKAPPNLLMAKAHETHPTDRAGMFRKRLVVAIETAEGRRLDETMVKELTGGDKITARRMREDFWEFSPTHTIIMATNHKPVVRGTDHGIWRRLRLVPFSVKVDGANVDTSMAEKLRAEYPGIFAWCVRGCLAWQELGLDEPQSVTAATDTYRSEQDVIGAFLEDRTLRNPAIDAKCGDVYAAYKEWAEEAGERPVSLKTFGQSMKERGFETRKSNHKYYIGIGLRRDNEDPSWERVA